MNSENEGEKGRTESRPTKLVQKETKRNNPSGVLKGLSKFIGYWSLENSLGISTLFLFLWLRLRNSYFTEKNKHEYSAVIAKMASMQGTVSHGVVDTSLPMEFRGSWRIQDIWVVIEQVGIKAVLRMIICKSTKQTNQSRLLCYKNCSWN